MIQQGKPAKKQIAKKNKTFAERCEQVYDFFMGFYHKKGMSPTFSQMSEGTGISRGNLHLYTKYLVKEHKLIKQDGEARGLLPAPQPEPPYHWIKNESGTYSLRWAGHIAADNKNPLVLLDLPDPDSTIEVPVHLLPPKSDIKKMYVLQVNGDSMTGANIADGDYVVIQSGNSYREGEIAVVYIKDKNAVTLKMLRLTERGNVKLQPKSQKHHPRIEKSENVEIQGRVVAVMRKC